jgi:hypothetical protein
MAIPALKLNLVPAPTLWRERHETLGWSGLAFGLFALVGCLTAWGIQAARIQSAGKESIQLSRRAQEAAQKELALRKELATLDITKEMPRWRLAERIYLERGLPWSRITAELERTLVDGVRTKALSRTRGSDGTVELKLRGESRKREDEAEFIENLQKNGLFVQVVLEREAERQGGGIDFELRLPMVATPPPYEALPTPEERKKAYVAKHGKVKPPPPPPPAVTRRQPEPAPIPDQPAQVTEMTPAPMKLALPRPARPTRGPREDRDGDDPAERGRRGGGGRKDGAKAEPREGRPVRSAPAGPSMSPRTTPNRGEGRPR